MEKFVVKRYAADERPSIKGNGFDGLEVGEDRQDAEEFVAWINRLIDEVGDLRGFIDGMRPHIKEAARMYGYSSPQEGEESVR